MTIYHGNGAYCYANSASMLLSTIGEYISPSLIEVITGFALGAFLERNNMIFFDTCTSSPDRGVCHAFEILGFNVIEKVSKESEQIPIEELKTDLLISPVMLGPLDMGHLNYNPNYRNLGGCDHYILALDINEKEILLHDPAGFPYVWLSLEQLELAWKAEKITWSSGSYRSWVSPQRISNPTKDELYNNAVELFKVNYEEQKKYAFKEDKPVGRNAIRLKAERIRNGIIDNGEIGHLIHFAFPVGARRALDFSTFFNGRHTQLTTLKNNQAQLFGKCQSLAVGKKWNYLAETLELLADTEGEIETAILSL
ncbi:hypothetical protein SAMN03159341_10359 [Paenibacillus sp. 1_12]|uniref:hypothetical protein n=1 Tax=Paenibacillus sp. 1_12 TaxID=1566278 RepID=UPI0008E2DF4E|nr:hypothetical protein [Paenibacillus sp. 1_12]SFL07054.1 hypothetical protein SAMN03159341_10359 [Paenibacillus sp. 1_12]